MMDRRGRTEDEADLAHRVAEYLKLNGFRNLEEAAAKGWGDIRPLVATREKKVIDD